MTWYAIDAVDRAFSRTRRALFEPFDFWKWVKLAIIIFFVGGIGSNYGGSGSNYQAGSEDFVNDLPSIEPEEIPYLPSGISGLGSGYIESISPLAIIAAIIGLFVLFILVFSYISSTMEFVFVEALVKNEVHLRAYFRKFMRKGLNLLLIRLAIGIIFLVLLLLSFLPFIPVLQSDSPDFAVPALVGGFFWIFGVIIFLALIGAIIGSFLSLAIPISIYRQTGILSAFRMVYRNFRKSWQEVLIYWFIRFALGLGVGILAVILFGLLILALAVVFIIVDMILYFLFSMVVSDPINWLLLIPFVLLEFLFIFATLMLLSVPLSVFLKYHLLSFLEIWFIDADIPFFDKTPAVPEIEPGMESETGQGTQLNKPEQHSSEQSILEQKENELSGSGSGDSGGSGVPGGSGDTDGSGGSESSVSSERNQ
ncbi:hypothetical protein RSJ42_06280 [Methanosarcina hadiensis]|uniref:DUF7544 domain-containing protein n=1 Tax=Methanosarcina hadiensis TaxID=3078083 RepID=UPI003977BD75